MHIRMRQSAAEMKLLPQSGLLQSQTCRDLYFYKDQGIYTLISHVDDTRVLDEYVGKQLGKLFRYDEINTGNLCETLENYLAHNCNAKKTAETMFLHRNTMNYRLKNNYVELSEEQVLEIYKAAY